jgi:ABC-2 type transport system ATP-binding protein
MAASSPVIEVKGLEKRYGDVHAVRGIDLEVQPGETFGFLGPNGAGKSTTIRILCTLALPSAGQATVAGFDVVRERAAVRRNIGLVFQDPTLDTYLSAERNLRFHGELYGVPRAQITTRSREVLEMVGLWDRRKAAVRTFSGGMKRRLEIARGLLHSPRVLFLDEPTVGLDPQTRLSIWNYLAELHTREEITIFLTTHYMDEAENCDRIAIINEGRLIALGTPAELKASVGTDRVQIRTADDDGAIVAIRDRFGIESERRDGTVQFQVPDGEGFVPRLFTELDLTIRSVSVARPSLDDVFLAYTGTTIRDAEDASGSAGMRAFARTR